MSSDKPPPEYYYGNQKKHFETDKPSPLTERSATPGQYDWYATKTENESTKHLPYRAGATMQVRSGPLAFPECPLQRKIITSIRVQPYVPFRAHYLCIESGIASSILIHSLKVGNLEYNRGPFPIHGAIFSVVSLAKLEEKLCASWSRWDLGTCEVAQAIQIQVENTHPTFDIRFYASLFGNYVEV